MRRMKDSGIAWIGEIPEGWEIKRLKFICTINPRVNTDDISPETEVSFLPMENIKYGYFINTIIKKFSEYCSSYNIFNDGDILLSKVTPCFENGNIAIANNLENCIGFGTSEIFVVRANNIDNKFLFYYFRSELFRQRAIATMSGTGGLKRISPQFMRDENILFPPLPEQHRIAAYLDDKCAEIDRSMELVRQSMDKLKAYRMSVITEAVTKGLDPDVPMKDSGVPWIGEIPEHWKCCPIKYFGDIVGGTGFPLEYQGNTEEIYPFYKVSDLELSSDGKFLTTPNNSISEEIAKLIHAKIIRKQSIVYAKIGAALLLNRRRIIMTDSIIDNNMSAFTPISGINLNWCFYLFTVIDFSIFIYPGTVPSFSEGAQSRIKVPVPPKDAQDKISSYLDAKCAEIDAIIARKQELLDKLAAYKKSLIFECVTGKREVAA